LPLGIAVQILVQACRGLQAAHELRGADGQPLGLAHCDVSPQNLMIDGSGVVKLIDFGIAKVRRFDGGGDDRVRGKPSFMAPEQAMRQHVDLRADIFSLGIMGYLLTTGRHPFGARNATDTLLAICSDVPVAAPCSVVESYPRALQRVVLRALARQPALRYQSAAEMLEDLVAAFPGYASESELAGLLHSACGSALDSRRALVNEALGRYSTPTLADSPVAPALLAEPTSDTLSPAQLAAQPAFAAARTTRWRPTHVAVAAGVVAFTAAFSWTVTQTAARFGVPSERAAPVVHAARASESPTQVAALPSAGAQAAPQSSPAAGGADPNHPPAPTEPAPESVAPAASNGRSASQKPPAKKRKVIAVGQRYGI
jgi:serine/threonine-protein kinase